LKEEGRKVSDLPLGRGREERFLTFLLKEEEK